MSLTDQSVLVTGGAGAFGKAFVQRALDDGARRVVVFSRSESAQAAMMQQCQDDRLRFIIGDIRDQARITDACRGVNIVVHAAALKRVEVCERHPREAIATNVDGTGNVAKACISAGVQKAVFLSTDKAAASATLYGATKLTAERLWNGFNVYAAGTPTRFASTRYGNVIASTGSVIPLWKQQAANGGLITLTDKRMSRFLMGMDQAVDLVLLALTNMRGGETFIPKIAAARMIDLAQAVAPDAGFTEIGCRPGEKLHETLITEDEARHTWDMVTYYVIEPAERTWGTVYPLGGQRVSDDFTYRSDTGPWLSIAELQGMIG